MNNYIPVKSQPIMVDDFMESSSWSLLECEEFLKGFSGLINKNLLFSC